MRKLAKITNINFFQSTRNEPKVCSNWKSMYLKNSWILIITVSSLVFNSPKSHTSLSSSAGTLKTHSQCSLRATGESKLELEIFQSLIPKELSLFDLPSDSLEDLICKTVCMWTDSETVPLQVWKNISPRVGEGTFVKKKNYTQMF